MGNDIVVAWWLILSILSKVVGNLLHSKLLHNCRGSEFIFWGDIRILQIVQDIIDYEKTRKGFSFWGTNFLAIVSYYILSLEVR